MRINSKYSVRTESVCQLPEKCVSGEEFCAGTTTPCDSRPNCNCECKGGCRGMIHANSNNQLNLNV